MSTFRAVKLYSDGGGLSEAKLDALFNSISDWINAANIDASNIQDNSITGNLLSSDFTTQDDALVVENDQLSIRENSVGDDELSGNITNEKIATGSVSITKTNNTTNFALSDAYDNVTSGSVTYSVSKANSAIFVQIVPDNNDPTLTSPTKLPSWNFSSTTQTVELSVGSTSWSTVEFVGNTILGAWDGGDQPLGSLRWILLNVPTGEQTFNIDLSSTGTLSDWRILVKEL